MRLLHLVHQYVPDHVAGTELYTQMLARRQSAAGHKVSVFAPVGREPAGELLIANEDGIQVFRATTGPRSPAAVFRSNFGQQDILDAFRRTLAATQPDIVHVQHMMGLPVADIGAALARAGVPYVLSLHDYWYGCANGQLLTNDTEQVCDGPDARAHNCGRCAVARAGVRPLAPLVGPSAAPVMRRRNRQTAAFYNGAARVLAPNPFVRDIYGQMGLATGRMVLAPLGLDAPDDLSERVNRARAARTQGTLRLGYLGSISRQKGVHVLVSAVNGLSDASVTLDIYGDLNVFPDYAAELQALARHPGIRFQGTLPRDRVWDTLAGLDALVMPTLWYEASPAIIREAFAVRLPVVASAIGAPGSMVREGVDGLLFPPGDAEALRRILLSLAENSATLARLRAGIEPVLTVSAHLAALEAAYREVVGDVSPTGATLA